MAAEATYRGTVYPWQCDHVGHMNIMWYVGKFDEANWNFFARLGLTPTYLRESGRGMAAVQQNISCKRELLAGDIVEITSSRNPRQVDPRRPRDAQCRDRRDCRELRDHRRAYGPHLAQVDGVHPRDPRNGGQAPCDRRVGYRLTRRALSLLAAPALSAGAVRLCASGMARSGKFFYRLSLCR